MVIADYINSENTPSRKTFPGSVVHYRLPGNDEKVRMAGNAVVTTDYDFIQSGRQGFILSPFRENHPVLWMEANRVAYAPLNENSDYSDFPGMPSYQGDRTLKTVTGEEYMKQVENVRNQIREGAAGKVVISRQLQVALFSGFHPVKFFDLLCRLYPEAFIYLACFPGHGCWTGATPETMVSFSDGRLSTMALAGTRQSGSSGNWNEKDLNEHRFVVEYIGLQLSKAGCSNISVSETAEITAGRVMHLLTRFNAGCRYNELASVVRHLHPTPAVCGWPAEKALEIIRNTEIHDRAYYTGFLGPAEENKADLFVNLRCLQLFGDRAVLYTGGGLTAESDPAKEWDETVLKSTTMLSAIEKLRNLAD